MQSDAKTPKAYLDSLPPERKKVVRKLRTHIRRGLPKGYAEIMSYGMLGYVVPLSIYPAGYHAKKNTPLPFINLASQKQHIAVYHMALYANSDLLKWFEAEYDKVSIDRLDMGKCCFRFRKFESVPYDLIEQLASKLTPEQWISMYEKSTGRKH